MEAMMNAMNPMMHNGTMPMEEMWSYLLGGLGASFAVGLSAIGGAIGTARAGMGLQAIKSKNYYFMAMVPVIMSGVVSIYGLILAVIIKGKMTHDAYRLVNGAMHLTAGLAVGIPCLAAGMAIGSLAKKWYEELDKPSSEGNAGLGKLILILIFAEAIGLYGLIVGLLLAD